jgi:NADP-reducing hydrogenase subunit HndB
MVDSKKIQSVQELVAIRDAARARVDVRQGLKAVQITVHMGTCGIAAGAREVLGELIEGLSAARAEEVSLSQSGCAGLCSHEPMLSIRDKDGREYRYGKLDRARVREIVQQHVLGGHPVEKYLIA